MKKYIMPQTKVVSVSFEGVIAASKVIIGSGQGENMLSNGKHGWDCSEWSTDEEEEEDF